jgi:hypothetical protein
VPKFKEGDKVTVGVLPDDSPLKGTVDGFYKEYVVIKFDSKGFYLSRTKTLFTSVGQWYHSMMVVHPSNLQHRKEA